MKKIFIKMYSFESRCGTRPENILFAGASLHLSARNFTGRGSQGVNSSRYSLQNGQTELTLVWRIILSTYSLHHLSSGRVPRLRPSLKLPRGRRQYANISLAGAATSIIFVATTVLSRQTRVCRDNTRLSSRQKYACRDKTFIATKLFLSRQNIFVETKDVFCRDKHVSLPLQGFVGTKLCFSRQIFVATKVCLSRPTRVCRDKHTFVATKHLSRQKLYLWQLSPMIGTII